MQTFVNPPALHDPTAFGYSHTVAVPADARFVLVAGQYGSGPTGDVVPGDFADQVRQAFANLGAALEAHDATFADVVQLRTYVVGLGFDELGALGRAVGGIWGSTPPTNTVLGVATLALPDIRFEVEAIAVAP